MKAIRIVINCETSNERKLLDAITTLMENANFTIDSEVVSEVGARDERNRRERRKRGMP